MTCSRIYIVNSLVSSTADAICWQQAWKKHMSAIMANCSRACLKNHSHNLHAPFCGIFCPNSVAVARYGALIRTKSPTNCDAHLAESLFQTRSRRWKEWIGKNYGWHFLEPVNGSDSIWDSGYLWLLCCWLWLSWMPYSGEWKQTAANSCSGLFEEICQSMLILLLFNLWFFQKLFNALDCYQYTKY